MSRFPIFVEMAGRHCLVVGGGTVGCAKAEGLLACGARVLLVEPRPSAAARALAERHRDLGLAAETFESRHLDGVDLAFACTDNPEVQDAVAAAARGKRVWLCRSDSGRDGDFSTAALLRRGDLCVAVSTSGASPALAAEVRDRIAELVGPEVAEAATLLGSMRASLAGDAPRSRALARELLDLLLSGRREEALALAGASKRPVSEDPTCTR